MSKKSVKKSVLHWLKNHPVAVPTVTLSVLIIGTLIGFLTVGKQSLQPVGSHIVYVTIEGKQKILPTTAATVETLLQRLNVTIHEGDVVEPELETPIVEDGFRINVYRARSIIVQDGTQRIVVSSAAISPRVVAAQAGVNVYPEDIVEKSPIDNFVKDSFVGEKIVLERATAVGLNLYGTQATVRTHANTVGELLKEKNITLGVGDSIKPTLEAPVGPATQVFVIRAGSQVVSAEESVAFTTETIDDPSLSFGTIIIRQRGSVGKKLVTYQIETINGQEVKRTKIQEVTIQAPVRQITARGKAIYIPEDKSAWMAAAGISQADYPFVNFIISRESGWCPTKWQGQVGYCPSYYQEKFPGAETATSLGFGLCQSTPAIKMASSGEDWRTNPVTQLKWCSGYAIGRYGSWEAAYNFWLARHWW